MHSGAGDGQRTILALFGKYRHYLLTILALAAIVAVALLSHTVFRSHFVRAPTDFLPASTVFAIGTDLRPNSPAMRHLRKAWAYSDINRLAGRSTDIAQQFVHWTGLQLHLGEEASAWFGGEIVGAGIGRPDRQLGGKPSFVLIARVTDERGARAGIDQAIEPLSREAGWSRSVIRRENRSIILWSSPSNGDAVAYAVHEGCILIGPTEAVIDQCLRAAADPSQRLTSTPEFAEALRTLPRQSLIWCYGSVPHLERHLSEALPHARSGWLNLLQYYRGGAPFARPIPPPTLAPSGASAGVLALGLVPVPEGVRIACIYRSGDSLGPSAAPREGEWDALAQVLPRDSTAYAFVHEPVRWLPAVDSFLGARAAWRGSGDDSFSVRNMLPLLMVSLGLKESPSDALLALVPREASQAPPAILAAVPNPDPTPAVRHLLPISLPLVTEQVGDVLVLATDQEVLDLCRRAAADDGSRLAPDLNPTALLHVWARPGETSGHLSRCEEVNIEVHGDVEGLEGELLLKASPTVLLGGD